MKRLVWITIGAALALGVHMRSAVAEDAAAPSADEEIVPKTVEGGSQTFKEGGQQIGEGFRGIGRGVKKVFTGQRSKEDFKDAAKIGTGARDVGLGTAGVGRGVGRGVKKAFKGEGSDD